jgi:hypothetical protein
VALHWPTIAYNPRLSARTTGNAPVLRSVEALQAAVSSVPCKASESPFGERGPEGRADLLAAEVVLIDRLDNGS